VSADGGPFVADREGAVDEFTDESFRVGRYGDDDRLRYGLGECLIDEFTDCFALEANTAVGCVAVHLGGGHEVF